MMSTAGRKIGGAASAPGRPSEIEDPTNRWLIHPLSRALVDRLIHTPITPNQVSVAGFLVGAAGAIAYVRLSWPWSALIGLAFWIAWHVLDGADGDLARRTGRASPLGELIDGVCDHASQVVLYVAFALVLQRSMGAGAWWLASAAGASHFAQANAYESGRKTYRRWVYGAAWMRQTGSGGGLGGLLGGLYLGVSALLSPGESEVETAMERRLSAGGSQAKDMRDLYRQLFAPLVKLSGVLGGNSRTVVAFLAVLAGKPAWFFWFELTVLNVALVFLLIRRARLNAAFVGRLGASSYQAAAAPN